MKRLFGISIGVAVAAITLVSCSEEILDQSPDLNPDQSEVLFEEDINSAVTADALFEDVDDVADYGEEIESAAGARSVDLGRHADCATVTREALDGVVTIVVDFGEEGCVGKDGRLRKGKLIMTRSGRKGQPGHTKTITFEEYSVDTVGIEGLRTIENISEAGTRVRKFALSLVGGKLSFPDGTTVTRDSEKVREIYYNEAEEVFESTVFGTSEGLNKDDLTYIHSVDESTPLLYTRACRTISRIAAVSGVLLIQVEGESDKTIDFGDGTCDNLVTVTQDGISEEIEVNPKETRRRKQRTQS